MSSNFTTEIKKTTVNKELSPIQVRATDKHLTSQFLVKCK